MAEVFVDFRQLGRSYGHGAAQVVALESATATIHAGDRIAIVGPSGGGKSTLLQLIGALDNPSAGEVSWPALGDRAALRPRQIGYIFQTQSLLAPLSVVENVELPLLLVNEQAGSARSCALEVLAQLDLASLASKLPEELSGGQAQRVAVARAFAGRPRLILADEPTGQLDHPTAQHLFDVLLKAIEGSDTALVVATHDLAIAQRLAAQWQIAHGRLEAA